MPADTINNMILGFAVIISVLLIYALTLLIRFRQADRLQKRNLEEKE